MNRIGRWSTRKIDAFRTGSHVRPWGQTARHQQVTHKKPTLHKLARTLQGYLKPQERTWTKPQHIIHTHIRAMHDTRTNVHTLYTGYNIVVVGISLDIMECRFSSSILINTPTFSQLFMFQRGRIDRQNNHAEVQGTI